MKNNGCEYYNDCFSCPFSDCVKEVSKRNLKMIDDWHGTNKSRKVLPEDKIDLENDKPEVRNYSRSMIRYYKAREEHKCYTCGKKLKFGYNKVTCPECREKQRQKYLEKKNGKR